LKTPKSEIMKRYGPLIPINISRSFVRENHQDIAIDGHPAYRGHKVLFLYEVEGGFGIETMVLEKICMEVQGEYQGKKIFDPKPLLSAPKIVHRHYVIAQGHI
jgi:hypothetical protein